MSIDAMKMALKELPQELPDNFVSMGNYYCEHVSAFAPAYKPMSKHKIAWLKRCIAAATALRAAIEAAEKQEPVARLYDDGTYIAIRRDLFRPPYVRDQGVEVFTAPQPAIPPGMVLAKVANLIACRDALVDKDRDEAYHQLYTSCDWTDPYSPWAEWEAVLAAAPKPGDKE